MITLAEVTNANVTTLRKMATTAEIPGRSKMGKDELTEALIKHYNINVVDSLMAEFVEVPTENTTHANSSPHLPGYLIDCVTCEAACFCDDSVATGGSMPCIYCQTLAEMTTDEVPEIVEACEIAYQEHKNTCGGCVKCKGFMTNISRRKAYNKQTGRTVTSRKNQRKVPLVCDFLDIEFNYIHGQFTPKQERRMNKKARKHAVDANGMTNGNSYVMHWYNSESAVTCK